MTTSAHNTPLKLAPHIIIPVVLAVLGTICQYAGVDEWLIRPFYNASTHDWHYDGNWWIAGLIHKGGRDLIAVLLSSLFIAIIASFYRKALAPYRRDLTYLLVAALSGILIVAILKSTTHIYIPSELTVFGGTMPHIRLFDSVPPGLPIGHAFPAGHSSGAFALIGAYFLFTIRGSRWRFPALGACLALGFTFGIAQQIRGKHFFSHDLFSLAICWAAALVVLYAMGMASGANKQIGPQPSEQDLKS